MNENIAIGVAALLYHSKTAEERGVVVYYVKVGNVVVPQFRPMTPQELAARDIDTRLKEHGYASNPNERMGL